MIRTVSIIFLLGIHLFSIGQLPEVKWSFDTYDASFGQSIAADIDNDGILEITFGCYLKICQKNSLSEFLSFV